MLREVASTMADAGQTAWLTPQVDSFSGWVAQLRADYFLHSDDPRTPIDGVYLCGAATHPAGSVIALNGRNAATAVLNDLD